MAISANAGVSAVSLTSLEILMGCAFAGAGAGVSSGASESGF